MSLCIDLRQTNSSGDEETVFDDSITHNLSKMAKEANIYIELWQPSNIQITKANQLIAPLSDAMRLLKSDPFKFMQFNHEYGFGRYEDLIKFIEKYLIACISYPESDVYSYP